MAKCRLRGRPVGLICLLTHKENSINQQNQTLMKAPLLPFRGALAVIAGFTLSTTAALAGQVVVSNFDVDSDATAWYWESWSSTATDAFDTANAGGGAAGSGSLQLINNFPDSPGGYNQSVFSLALGSDVDAETLYTNISL